MKYYIIAGEASGDLHGANLIGELKKLDTQADIRAWGGDKMQSAGAVLVKHFKDLAFMGFVEVAMNIKTILSNIAFCKKDITAYNPDVLILVDYPGFNLRIAKWAKSKGIKVIYYISPQVWAWKESRVKEMKKNIDKMLVILPFEKTYFAEKWNWNVVYTGHPLVHIIEEFKNAEVQKLPYDKPVIALLPGSRKQEINKKLPIMLQVSKAFPEYQFVIANAPAQEDAFYERFLQHHTNVSTIKNETYKLLANASAALVTSGTATLETALFEVPEVVCYKGNNISYMIAKKLIKVKFISLVNLIMDRMIVRELIQDELTVRNLVTELNDLLHSDKRKAQLEKDYQELKSILSTGENASKNAALEVWKMVQQFTTACNSE